MKKNELKDLQKVLYNIDMVKGFAKEGKISDKGIMEAVSEQIKLIEKFRKENQGLGIIKDNHTKYSTELKRFPEHCLKDTEESEIIDELKKYEKDTLIYLKNSTSAIFAPNMIEDLHAMKNLKMVVGTGCLTHICVPNFLIPLKNFFDEYNRDVAVFAVKDAISNINSDERRYQDEIAYYMMQQNGIIVVENLEELECKEQEMGLTYKKIKGDK